MATTASDIYVRSGASGSFTAVQFVQGGWITVPSASNMYSIYEDRLADGQIIYVQNQNQLYSVSKFIAFETPGYAGFKILHPFLPLHLLLQTRVHLQLLDQTNSKQVSRLRVVYL